MIYQFNFLLIDKDTIVCEIDAEDDSDDDMPEIIEVNVERDVDNVAAGLQDVELNNEDIEFAAFMSVSNVNSSSHGLVCIQL